MYTGALLLSPMAVLVALKEYRPPIKLQTSLLYMLLRIFCSNGNTYHQQKLRGQRKTIKHTQNPVFGDKSN